MADDRPISWDLDSVLNLNMTWYREQYPYPYFHYLPAHTHIVNRASFIAPLHFFFEWLLVSILFYLLRNVVEAVILNVLQHPLSLSLSLRSRSPNPLFFPSPYEAALQSDSYQAGRQTRIY